MRFGRVLFIYLMKNDQTFISAKKADYLVVADVLLNVLFL